MGAQLRPVPVRRTGPGGLVTAYQEMSAAELRDELADWNRQVRVYATKFLDARDAGEGLEFGLEAALRNALAQARKIERLLQLGVAA